MGHLVYAGIGSLDGFIADAEGEFDWSALSEEGHGVINEPGSGGGGGVGMGHERTGCATW